MDKLNSQVIGTLKAKKSTDKAKNVKLNRQNAQLILNGLNVQYGTENGKATKTILMNAKIVDACNKAIFDYFLSGSKTYLLLDGLLKKLQEKSKTQLKMLYSKALLDATKTDKAYNRTDKAYNIDIKISLAMFCDLVKNNLQLMDEPKHKNELL